MAIRVLLDHGVQASHIIFITFLAARTGGVAHLRRTFPEVHIVTATVDDGLREVWIEGYDAQDDEYEGQKAWVIEPGMGQIGIHI
jgi:uridine kinase